jgi:hypothetical protein
MDTFRRLETQRFLAETAGVSIDNADAVSRIVVELWDELQLGQLAEVIITLDTMLNALLTRERILILHSSSDLSESEKNPNSVSYPTSAQSVRLERGGFHHLGLQY